MERLFGFEGKNTKALEDFLRPYCCVICSQLCAMPSRSSCEEKKGMGAEWTMYRQTHTEISGVLICSEYRPGHVKVRIDSYRVSGNFGEKCNCTWNGTILWNCVVCGTKNRTLMSSRSLWESLRMLKPLGLFRDGIMSKFSRHPYLGMREHERKAFLETRIPIFPRDGKEARDRALQEREELVRKIKRRDREKDLSLTERESQKWNLTLWHEVIHRCFPEADPKQGSCGKFAWIYVKLGEQWQVRSWSDLAIELAKGGGWIDSPPYDKDYRGSQPRFNVTKEKRKSNRKEKFVQLTVSLANELEKHRVWCPSDETYVTGLPYNYEQIIEEPKETFIVIMHFKINLLSCAHPDYDWIGGNEVELHEKQPEAKVIKKGVLRIIFIF